MTDAQLSQQTELVFNGTGSVTVEKLYMAYKGTSPYFVPINNPAYSVQWMFEKAESVKNKMKYAYLDEQSVKQKDSVVNVATSYLLYNLKNDNSKQYFGGVTSDYKAATAKDDAKRVFFKKNVDGTYAMIELGKTDITAGNDEVNYSGLIKYDANKWSVNTTTAVFDAASATLDELNAPYSAVTVDFNALSESLEAVARHATFNSEEGAVAVKQNKNGILEGIIGEGMTFWLDTADIDKDFHSFYISKGIAEGDSVAPVRNFLYFAQDSLRYWNEAQAKFTYDENYGLEGTYGAEADQNTDVKAIFRPATLAGVDTINTTVNGKNVVVAAEAKEDVCLGGINNFKFYITKLDGAYSVRPVDQPTKYLYALNGKLGFTTDTSKALPVTVGEGNPTSNESIDNSASSSIVVTGNAGSVTIQGAQGETAYVRNLLGMPLAETVVTSDNATIAVPAGIVLVTVGDETVKVVVK